MKMKTKCLILLGAMLALISCGNNTSPGNDSGCIEECAMILAKEGNKCRLDHADNNGSLRHCSEEAISNNDRCTGKCFGNL